MPSITVLDSTGATQTVQTVPAVGPAAGVNSLPFVPATDTYALLPSVSTNVLLSATATTNPTSLKTSLGAIKSIQGYNAKASPVYLKLYNKASPPTVGTDTPVKTLYIPATSAFVFDFSAGYVFSTGIAYALTGAAAISDTTALAVGDILCLNIDYI